MLYLFLSQHTMLHQEKRVVFLSEVMFVIFFPQVASQYLRTSRYMQYDHSEQEALSPNSS